MTALSVSLATEDSLDLLLSTLVEECRTSPNGRDTAVVAARVVRALPVRRVRQIATRALVDAVARKVRGETVLEERAAVRPLTRTSVPDVQAQDPLSIQRKEASRKATLDALKTVTASRASVSDLVEQYRRDVRIEWTASLLAAELRLQDGTATTWGAATVNQHAARREMFMQFANRNIEGAARHSQAIEDLERSAAASLYEMVMPNA